MESGALYCRLTLKWKVGRVKVMSLGEVALWFAYSALICICCHFFFKRIMSRMCEGIDKDKTFD